MNPGKGRPDDQRAQGVGNVAVTQNAEFIEQAFELLSATRTLFSARERVQPSLGTSCWP